MDGHRRGPWAGRPCSLQGGHLVWESEAARGLAATRLVGANLLTFLLLAPQRVCDYWPEARSRTGWPPQGDPEWLRACSAPCQERAEADSDTVGVLDVGWWGK